MNISITIDTFSCSGYVCLLIKKYVLNPCMIYIVSYRFNHFKESDVPNSKYDLFH